MEDLYMLILVPRAHMAKFHFCFDTFNPIKNGLVSEITLLFPSTTVENIRIIK